MDIGMDLDEDFPDTQPTNPRPLAGKVFVA